MINRPYFTIAAAFAALLGIFHASPALADDDGVITYRVAQGDTLIGLASKYMLDERSVEIVRQLNRVDHPTKMQTGTMLRIPRAQLRSVPVLLRVQNATGPVTLITGGARAPALRGATVKQGMEIETGRKGFVALVGTRGALVTLPSRSHARLRSAKRYVINNALDIDFEIISGRSSIRAPKLRSQERFRTRTPVAVSAVRGTEFRVGFDPDTALATTEVVEGAVVISDDAAQATAPAGFGVTANPLGVKQPEALLPPPAMESPSRLQTSKLTEFTVVPMSGATAYRMQIGADAGFVEIVDEQLIQSSTAQFTDLANGRYFVRTSAVAESGLEGLSQVHSFRRQQLGVSAHVEKSALANGFKFAWAGEAEGDVLYAFQLWDTRAPHALLVDELGMQGTSMVLTDLDTGKYAWRVAALQMQDEGLVKIWSDPQTLSVDD
ncbi:FecR domain-containing protein [Pontixanthobacter sp.]|uniref:FecR family protein n=1 Tax=Pontixanthobacter sp. TaxID=2792078 RepID=UPI003C7B4CA9